jgi:hypothetical protein
MHKTYGSLYFFLCFIKLVLIHANALKLKEFGLKPYES